MKHHPRYWLTLVAVLLFSSQAVAAGVQFSADMMRKAGGKTSKMRYYQGDQKMPGMDDYYHGMMKGKSTADISIKDAKKDGGWAG